MIEHRDEKNLEFGPKMAEETALQSVDLFNFILINDTTVAEAMFK